MFLSKRLLLFWKRLFLFGVFSSLTSCPEADYASYPGLRAASAVIIL